MVHDNPYYGNSSVFRILQNVGEKSNVGLHMSNSQLDEGYSRVLGTDGTLFLNDDWRFGYEVAGADDRLEDAAGQIIKDREDYYGYSSITYGKYPWDIGAGYRGISEGFDPVVGFIPRRDIFGPIFHSGYNLRSDERWYKRMFTYFWTQYYENGEGETSLRDYSVETGVTLQNDVGFHVGHADDYHRPFNNQRTHLGVVFDESDYWRSMYLGWAFGVFEEIDYHELSFGKHFKPIERWPIRYEYVIRFEEEPDGDEETIWLNRVVFDYFFSDVMWLKSSIQHRSTAVYNISLIYGWEFIKDAHLYVVYNNLREEDEPEDAQSIFIKLAYTFR